MADGIGHPQVLNPGSSGVEGTGSTGGAMAEEDFQKIFMDPLVKAMEDEAEAKRQIKMFSELIAQMKDGGALGEQAQTPQDSNSEQLAGSLQQLLQGLQG